MRRRLAWYLVVWSAVGLSFCALLARQAGLGRGAAIAVGMPALACLRLRLPVGLVCVALYPTRQGGAGAVDRIGRRRVASQQRRLGGTRRAAGAAYSSAGSVCTRLSKRSDRSIFGFGQVAYLMSLSVSYIAGAARADADRGTSRTRGPGAFTRSGASLAARADRSAFPVQQSSFDQRADVGESRPARDGCACCWRIFSARVSRSARRIGSHSARELALAQKYLEIERVRFGDRLGVEIESSGEGDCMVPSLILQPVVENAVTHGIAHLLEGGVVRVTTSCSPVRIVMVWWTIRVMPIGRGVPAAASGWPTSVPGCARCMALKHRSRRSSRTAAGGSRSRCRPGQR